MISRTITSQDTITSQQGSLHLRGTFSEHNKIFKGFGAGTHPIFSSIDEERDEEGLLESVLVGCICKDEDDTVAVAFFGWHMA